jgi:hypothetical protein
VATKAEHQTKAEHNEKMVSALGDPFCDWKICGMFYAAVHYVHSYFAAKKVTLPVKMDHKKRLTLVQWHLRKIYKDYEELYNNGRDARYEADLTFTLKEVQQLEKKLESIKAEIMPFIKPAPAPPPPPRPVKPDAKTTI